MTIKELDELNAAFWVEQNEWAKTKDGSAEEKAAYDRKESAWLKYRTAVREAGL